MFGLMQERPLSISSLIEYAARFHGRTPVVSRLADGSIHRTDYATVRARAAQLATWLCAQGVRPGDRIATLAWNTHRHVELYYAVSGIGAVLHTVNPRLSTEQLEYILNHAEDRLLFFDESFAPLIHKLRPNLRTVQTFVALAAADSPVLLATGGPTLSVEALLAATPVPTDFAWPMFDENTASSLCYTSGTTGNPKGVLYSHRSTLLHSFAVCAADGLALSSRDSVLVVVPLFHANGWGIPYAAAMCGAKLVLPGHLLDGASLCQLMRDEQCTLSMGVPTVWQNLFAYLDKHPQEAPTTLRRVLIGGSAAPPAMIERFETALGVEVLHLWGMTETSPVGTCGSPTHALSHDSPDVQRRRKHKQGRAFFGVDLRIVDEHDQPRAHDGQTPGLLKVAGPWVASQYFRGEGGEILDRDGYFSTGDVATIDGDGYLQLTDRAKDLIKSGGEWISSLDLEAAAQSFPGIAQVAVIALPHPTWVERPLMVIVRKPGAEIDPAALLGYLGARVTKFWLPDDIVFVEQLPYTATGKISKLTLRAQFKDHTWSTLAAAR